MTGDEQFAQKTISQQAIGSLFTNESVDGIQPIGEIFDTDALDQLFVSELGSGRIEIECEEYEVAVTTDVENAPDDAVRAVSAYGVECAVSARRKIG